MSLERASINCDRCFNLVGILASLPGLKHTPKRELAFTNDRVYQVRNEALKALEETKRDCLKYYKEERITLYETEHGIATNALIACTACNYSEPRIVKSIEHDKESTS